MHLRTAAVHDAAAMANVHVESWRTTYKGIVPDDFLASLSSAQHEQLWRQVLTDPNSRTVVYIVEEEDGKIVGFASGGPERSGDPVYTGELYAIYLLVQYQGQGIGRQLLSTLANRLQQDSMTTLLLWVLAENSARKFYERLGGHPLYEKTVTIGGLPLIEVAYGWQDVETLIAPLQRQRPPGRNSPG